MPVYLFIFLNKKMREGIKIIYLRCRAVLCQHCSSNFFSARKNATILCVPKEKKRKGKETHCLEHASVQVVGERKPGKEIEQQIKVAKQTRHECNSVDLLAWKHRL